MKHTNYLFFLSLTAMLLCLKLNLNGQMPNFQVEQDSYDSIKRATIISIHNSPYSGSKTNIDTIIQNYKTNYPKDWKFIEWDTQKSPFHSSVPYGNLFLVKDHDNIIKESIAYISSNDYTIAFAFKPSNSDGYNDYIGVYTTFLSSIRCSKISR